MERAIRLEWHFGLVRNKRNFGMVRMEWYRRERHVRAIRTKWLERNLGLVWRIRYLWMEQRQRN